MIYWWLTDTLSDQLIFLIDWLIDFLDMCWCVYGHASCCLPHNRSNCRSCLKSQNLPGFGGKYWHNTTVTINYEKEITEKWTANDNEFVTWLILKLGNWFSFLDWKSSRGNDGEWRRNSLLWIQSNFQVCTSLKKKNGSSQWISGVPKRAFLCPIKMFDFTKKITSYLDTAQKDKLLLGTFL